MSVFQLFVQWWKSSRSLKAWLGTLSYYVEDLKAKLATAFQWVDNFATIYEKDECRDETTVAEECNDHIQCAEEQSGSILFGTQLEAMAFKITLNY